MFHADTQIPVPTLAPHIFRCLSETSQTCVRRLLTYFANTTEPQSSLFSRPLSKLAAVLVLLYEEDGQLRVLLTTRSKSLRTHPGQTALPGGRVDPEDEDFVAAALREANEEIGLPLHSPHIQVLGLVSPSVSLHRLVVVPVVALLTQLDHLKSLSASEQEVAHIFSHPLEAILDPSIAQKESLVPIGCEHWPYNSDYYNTSDYTVQILGNTPYRMHRFRTSASPVKGLTADFLIKTAEIAYGRPTTYERFAPDQLTTLPSILRVLDDTTPQPNTT